MPQNKSFGNVDDATEKQYTREARLQYDPELVNESMQRWNSYTALEKQGVKDEGNRIYQAIAGALTDGKAATDEDVQALFVRWHDHLRNFYEPSLELLEGLGQLYNTDPRFIENFAKLHPDLPAFLQEGITHYVDRLETAAIAQMLAEDEAQQTANEQTSQ